MDAGQFLKRHVADLREHAQDFYDVGDGVANSFDSWSALKLALHAVSVSMYTGVHKDRTGDIFYIDALAGSGISEYTDGQCFLGSPLLACKSARTPFSRMYFIENDGEKADALRDRLRYAFTLDGFTKPDEWRVFEEDANEQIDEVIEEIWDLGDHEEGFNYFTFIDNQGMDVEWPFIDRITPKPFGDFLINVPIAHAVGRNPGEDATNDFYGCDTGRLRGIHNSRQKMLDLYSTRLTKAGRPVQTSTTIDANSGSFNYEMVYATRDISGGNKYMEVIDYAKLVLEKVHAGHVDGILDVLEGDQMELNVGEWTDNETPDIDIRVNSDPDDAQTGLADFT